MSKFATKADEVANCSKIMIRASNIRTTLTMRTKTKNYNIIIKGRVFRTANAMSMKPAAQKCLSAYTVPPRFKNF